MPPVDEVPRWGGRKLARRDTKLTDAVIAALIAAAFSAPVAGFVAYSNHTQGVIRLENERTQHDQVAELAKARLLADRDKAVCSAALGYLQDESPNAALPPAEAQVLLADMRRAASTCSDTSGTGTTATVGETGSTRR